MAAVDSDGVVDDGSIAVALCVIEGWVVGELSSGGGCCGCCVCILTALFSEARSFSNRIVAISFRAANALNAHCTFSAASPSVMSPFDCSTRTNISQSTSPFFRASGLRSHSNRTRIVDTGTRYVRIVVV